MPRERSPDRDKAKQIWISSNGKLKLKDLAAELGLGETQIRKWKSQDKWDVSLKSNVTNEAKGNVTKRIGAPKGNKNAVGNKGGAPKGSKNALGNRGGYGGPPGNKKAVSTGEFESIWMDTLEEDEQELARQVETDPVRQADEAITLLSIRERRMLQRIQNLRNALSEKQRKVIQERIAVKDVQTIHDEKTGTSKSVVVPMDKLVTTKIEESDIRVIDDLLRLEEALTRVQDKKLKAIDLKNRFVDAERDLRIQKLQAEVNSLNNNTVVDPVVFKDDLHE
ncbi:terminase [Paenibacillus sp. LMG 31461]|uniref:Terminase n=1 Tax=Paenibacillus plantarum TaxID=2654975 RepID=A0ABX1XKJ9_9BACL|nr:phage terminase small subunit [Paenibacillus plantarum]NOU68374.1 terminase [Paenibacillus plantarum]